MKKLLIENAKSIQGGSFECDIFLEINKNTTDNELESLSQIWAMTSSLINNCEITEQQSYDLLIKSREQCLENDRSFALAAMSEFC